MSSDSGDSGTGDLGGNDSQPADYPPDDTSGPPSASTPPPSTPAPTDPEPGSPTLDPGPSETPPDGGGPGAGLNVGLPLSILGGVVEGDAGDLPGLGVDVGGEGDGSGTGLDLGNFLPTGEGLAVPMNLAGLTGGIGDVELGGATVSVGANASDNGLVDLGVDAASGPDDGSIVLVIAGTEPDTSAGLPVDVIDTGNGSDGSLIAVGDASGDADNQLLSVNDNGDAIVAVSDQPADNLLTVDTGSDDTSAIIANFVQGNDEATVSANANDGDTSLLIDAGDVTADAAQEGTQSDASVGVTGPVDATVMTGLDSLGSLLLQ